jgi:hypothetical protein
MGSPGRPGASTRWRLPIVPRHTERRAAGGLSRAAASLALPRTPVFEVHELMHANCLPPLMDRELNRENDGKLRQIHARARFPHFPVWDLHAALQRNNWHVGKTSSELIRLNANNPRGSAQPSPLPPIQRRAAAAAAGNSATSNSRRPPMQSMRDPRWDRSRFDAWIAACAPLVSASYLRRLGATMQDLDSASDLPRLSSQPIPAPPQRARVPPSELRRALPPAARRWRHSDFRRALTFAAQGTTRPSARALPFSTCSTRRGEALR